MTIQPFRYACPQSNQNMWRICEYHVLSIMQWYDRHDRLIKCWKEPRWYSQTLSWSRIDNNWPLLNARKRIVRRMSWVPQCGWGTPKLLVVEAKCLIVLGGGRFANHRGSTRWQSIDYRISKGKPELNRENRQKKVDINYIMSVYYV